LEDLQHRALSFAGHPAATLLKDWTSRSRQVPGTPQPVASGPEGWMTTPVGPRSRRWGRLVIPRRVVDDDAVDEAAAVLTHAADALTIGRLLGDDSLGLELQAQGELLQDLLRGTTLDEPALRARARALGLPTGNALTVVVIGASAPDPYDQQIVEAAVAAARALHVAAIIGRLGPGRVAVVAAPRSRKDDARLPERLVELLPSGFAAAAATAGPVTAFINLASALAEAVFVVDVVTATRHPGPVRVWKSSDLGVQGLLWQLREDPRLQAFVDTQLEPLMRLDDRTRAQMLETLLAHLEADSGMTGFAARIGLSRPAAYARLARLRQVIPGDLDDPRVRLSLHLALLAMKQDRDATTALAVTSAETAR
jgi:purine catabolism regulator